MRHRWHMIWVAAASAACLAGCGQNEEQIEEANEVGTQYIRERKSEKLAGTETEAQTAAADKLPARVSLDVPMILQKPELPTGCESVALAMALAYEGMEVDKSVIARDYLIYNREDGNMALGYVGDPFSERGAGCFAPVIQKTAEKYFDMNGIKNGSAYDITGTALEDLFKYISANTPVIVWGTMYMKEPDFTDEVGEYRGREYRWYRQEHCVVLSGYDLEKQVLQINDPLEGIVTRELEEFRRIYDMTGQNAVILSVL